MTPPTALPPWSGNSPGVAAFLVTSPVTRTADLPLPARSPPPEMSWESARVLRIAP